jgi:hypothetical protein
LERTEHAERNAEIQEHDEGREGSALDRGDIDFLQAMVIQSEYRGAVWPAYPSPVAWKVLAKILAPIGRLLGYKAC